MLYIQNMKKIKSNLQQKIYFAKSSYLVNIKKYPENDKIYIFEKPLTMQNIKEPDVGKQKMCKFLFQNLWNSFLCVIGFPKS